MYRSSAARGRESRRSRTRSRGRHLALIATLTCALAPGCRPATDPSELTVFAAASLTELCAELGAAFEPASVNFNFAGSNVLARQILAAPEAADLFLSADRQWAQTLVQEGLASAEPATVLSNSLVVVGWPGDSGSIETSGELASLPFRHLALADPDAVPAGRYARAWLEGQQGLDGSLWDSVQARVVPTLDVRAALALAESSPGILGVVYRTDARRARRARILHEVPEAEQPSIAYVALRLAPNDGESLAQSFLDFLLSERAREICSAHGFVTVL